jgi:hypothetical protein
VVDRSKEATSSVSVFVRFYSSAGRWNVLCSRWRLLLCLYFLFRL